MEEEDSPLPDGWRLAAEEELAAAAAVESPRGAMRERAVGELLHEVFLDEQNSVRIREMPFCDGVAGSTGGQVWPASIALARWLLRRPSLVDGKFVVELGAGCGLASVVAARYARRLLVTDGDQDAVQNACDNLLINASFWWTRGGDDGAGWAPAKPADVFARRLLWEDVAQEWPQDAQVDVIMGSDITYQNNQGHVLTKVAERLLRPGGIFIAVSDASRGGVHFFRDAMSAAGFDVEVSDCSDENGEFCVCTCRRAEARQVSGFGTWYLPEQWEEYHDPSLDTPYYWNAETGEIVWSLAETGAVRAAAAA